MINLHQHFQQPCVECAVFQVTGNGCRTSAEAVLYEYVALQEVAGTRTATLVVLLLHIMALRPLQTCSLVRKTLPA